jgi:hypothetical protein
MAVFVAGSAGAQTAYQFTVIAKDPGYQVGAPALNDAGQTAFGVSTLSGVQDAQVIRANVGESTKIFGIQGQTAYSALGELRVSINNEGTVAFYVYRGNSAGTAILTGSGGVPTTIADTTVDTQFNGVFKPSVHNNAGIVAFEATLAGQTGDSIIIHESSGAFEQIAGPGTVITGLGTLNGTSQPIINGTGTVLFYASGDLGGGLVYSAGASPTIVTNSAVGYTGFNNLNTASFDTGSLGSVYKGNGGTPILIAAAGAGGLVTLGDISSINDAGTVAFLADGSTGRGIFTGPDAVADRIIGVGDSIPGLGTVTSVDIGSEAINNHGQIAFVVGYTSGPGVSGLAIVRADPLCATDVSATVSVSSRGPLKLNKSTGRYTQTVTLKNGDGVVSGPMSLVLDNLSINATLFAADGLTACSTPTGSPYVNVNIGTDGVLSSKERPTVTLEFANPSGQPVTYATRILAGTGNR